MQCDVTARARTVFVYILEYTTSCLRRAPRPARRRRAAARALRRAVRVSTPYSALPACWGAGEAKPHLRAGESGAMNRVWAATLLVAAAVGLAPGARGEPCLEVTGATNSVGDDHTCALWAKGKYFLQDDDQLENGKPVWHREESHVHQWGVVVRYINCCPSIHGRSLMPTRVEACQAPSILQRVHSIHGDCLAPGRRGYPPRL
jgi:hypothetical protein